MNDSQNGVQFPEYYLSSAGPQISKTITNIALNILPVANLVLAKFGINILPASVNMWVTLIVFLYFTVQAMIGYVRSRKILGAEIANLQRQLGAVRSGGTTVGR